MYCKLRRLFAFSFHRAIFKGGTATTFQWGDWGVDTLDSDRGYRLIQYGRRGGAIRFVCRISKHVTRPPMFLLGPGWKCLYKSPYLLAGETAKPLPVSKLWR
jgi:hypothetical protein